MPNAPIERRTAQLTRDAALRRVIRARTGVLVGSAGLTAGLAVLVADTAPGKTYKYKPASAVVRAAALPPLATARELGLHPASPKPRAATTNTSTSASTQSQTATQSTATQPAATATQPTPTATQPAVTATQAAPAPPVPAPAAPAPVVSGGS